MAVSVVNIHASTDKPRQAGRARPQAEAQAELQAGRTGWGRGYTAHMRPYMSNARYHYVEKLLTYQNL